jgi:hypothetical protein
MKLHSPRLEKRIKRLVSDELHRSPALKKLVRKPKRTTSQRVAVRFLVSLLLTGLLMGVRQHGGLSAQLFVMTLWASISVCWLVIFTGNILYRPPDFHAVFNLPLTDSDIFQWEWQKAVKNAAFYIFDYVLGYAIIATYEQFGWQGWLGLMALSVLQWALVFGTSVLLMVHIPKFPFGAVAGFSLLVVFAFWIGHTVVSPFVFSLVEKASALPYWIVPTGWTVFIIKQFISHQWALGSAMLVPVILLGLAFRRARKRLRSAYVFSEIEHPAPEQMQVPMYVDEDAAEYHLSEKPIGVTQIEDNIRVGLFVKSFSWEKRPLLHRALGHLLSAREKVLAEIFLPKNQNWQAIWKKCALVVLGLAIAFQFSRLFNPSLFRLGFAGVGFFTVLALVPIGNPLAMAFTPYFVGGTNIPLYAGFPIGYQEISRLIMKITVVRWLAAIPLMLVLGLLSSGVYQISYSRGGVFTAKLLWLILAAQPFLIVCRFSATSNDTQARGIRSKILTLGMILVGITFLVASAIMLFSRSAPLNISMGLLAPGISFAFHQFYKWLFNRSRFDLMQIPAQTTVS